jgi:hypothetical protein
VGWRLPTQNLISRRCGGRDREDYWQTHRVAEAAIESTLFFKKTPKYFQIFQRSFERPQ